MNDPRNILPKKFENFYKQEKLSAFNNLTRDRTSNEIQNVFQISSEWLEFAQIELLSESFTKVDKILTFETIIWRNNFYSIPQINQAFKICILKIDCFLSDTQE